MEKEKQLSINNLVTSILVAILTLIVAVFSGVKLADIIITTGLPKVLAILADGAVRLIITGLVVKFLIEKILLKDLSFFRLDYKPIDKIWIQVAIGLPVLVSLALFLSGGSFVISDMAWSERFSIIVSAVFLYGIVTGIIEEIIFRGIIMTVVEDRFGKVAAILAPSLVFALLHVAGNEMEFMSFALLLIAGTSVGVMFSFITYAADSVWPAALVHAVWNILMIGGIINIGAQPYDLAIVNFVLSSDSFFITGGQFGVESSLFAIMGYIIVVCLAMYIIEQRELKKSK